MAVIDVRHLFALYTKLGTGRCLTFIGTEGPTTTITGPAVTLAGSTAAPLVINGTLSFSGGFLAVSGATGVNVQGDVTLIGGEITNPANNGVLTSNGNMTLNGTIAQTPPRLVCRGSWTSGPTFDPSSNTVELRGSTTTTVSSTVPSQPVKFHDLEVYEGERRLQSSVQVTGGTVLVQSNAGLTVTSGTTLKCFGPGVLTFTANGALEVDGGGTLLLSGTSTLTVNPSGYLKLLGTSAASAVIDGVGLGGYALSVSGRLAAQYFVVRRGGTSGFVITANALIDPSPNDFRNGTFDYPRNIVGSTLLTVTRTVATTLPQLTFQNSNNSQGTYNVTAPAGGAVIFMQNATGAFAGLTHEAPDPNNLVNWTAGSLTELMNFWAIPGPNQVTVRWTTTIENGVTGYVLERADTSSGPWNFVVFQPASGVPSSYTQLESALIPGQRYWWRLSEVVGNPPVPAVLGIVDGVPTSAAAPPNLLTVGPGGTFATIQSAVNAAALPNTVIRVAPGVYPTFTVNNPPAGFLKIVGDGGTVQIATNGGPLQVSNVGLNSQVELRRLAIDPLFGSTSAGLVVSNCQGLVLADECSVQGAVAQPGVRVVASAKVSLQRSQLSGTPGLKLESASFVSATHGGSNSADASGGSTLFRCQFSLLQPPVLSGGANDLPLPGLMPDLGMPALSSIGSTVTANIQGYVGSVYYLVMSAVPLVFDTSLPTTADTVLMMNLSSPTTQVPRNGTTSASGSAAEIFAVTADGSLLGQSFTFQVAMVTGGSPQLRLSNGTTVTLTP